MTNKFITTSGADNASQEATLAVELFLMTNYRFRRNTLNGKVEFCAKPSGKAECTTEADEADWGYRPLTQAALNSIVIRAKREQVMEKGSPKSEIAEYVASEEVPEYNFVTGKREWNGKKFKLSNDNVLIIEGIHALNSLLTKQIPDSAKYKVYISALTSISLDDHNWIPTQDNRLLRRIIRDYNKGAFSARETISQWKSVCEAEDLWIAPFQETADVMFNSALNIEFAVLRTHAEVILASVQKNCPEYAEAHRLLKFLHYFIPISDKEIPPTSIMREFVGGSSFKY